MGTAEDLTGKDPQEIETSIEETRASLDEKIDHLEEEVRETVQAARETVHQKVEHIKDAFSIWTWFRKRPASSFVASVGFGFLVARRLLPIIQRRLTQKSVSPNRMRGAV